MRRNETAYPILHVGRDPGVITYADFGDDRLRGLGIVGGGVKFSVVVITNTWPLPWSVVILKMQNNDTTASDVNGATKLPTAPVKVVIPDA